MHWIHLSLDTLIYYAQRVVLFPVLFVRTHSFIYYDKLAEMCKHIIAAGGHLHRKKQSTNCWRTVTKYLFHSFF